MMQDLCGAKIFSKINKMQKEELGVKLNQMAEVQFLDPTHQEIGKENVNPKESVEMECHEHFEKAQTVHKDIFEKEYSGHSYGRPSLLKLSFLVAHKPKAQEYFNMVSKIYDNVTPEQADVLVVLGGDGFMLQSVREYAHLKKPFYGVNCGNAGKLLNVIPSGDLMRNIAESKQIKVLRLQLEVFLENGGRKTFLAMNEVSVLRTTPRALKLQISVDGNICMRRYIGDGLLVSTPLGSLSYNNSVGGPILPFKAPLVSMMPVSPYNPRGWKGALLFNESLIYVRNAAGDGRPFMVACDNQEVHHVAGFSISKFSENAPSLCFNKDNTWNRIVSRAQFEMEQGGNGRNGLKDGRNGNRNPFLMR